MGVIVVLPHPVATFSLREFAHDPARVKRAAHEGPVFITDRGRPTYALMLIDDFQRLATGGQTSQSLLDVMDGLPSTADFDFEPPAVLPRVVEGVELD
jgi:prevent-host-death family protein